MTSSSGIDFRSPPVPLSGDNASTHTVTLGLDFDGSGSTWTALVRRKPTEGEFHEWTVDDTDAGTETTIDVDEVPTVFDGAVAISADFSVLEPGVWYWGVFRDGDTFLGLSTVTVREVVVAPA